MSSDRPPIPPSIAIWFGILAVSTASIFIRFAQKDAPSLTIAAYRLTLATLTLAPVAIGRYRQELFQLSKGRLLLGILSGVLLAFHFATWITSLEYTSVASSVVLVTTTPLWVALLSPIFLKERLSSWMIAGMGVALIGGTVVGMSDSCHVTTTGIICPGLALFFQGKAFFGDLLALAGALMAAGYLMAGRRLRPTLNLIPYTFLVYGVAAVVLVGLMFVAGDRPFGFPTLTYFWLLCLAVIPQLLGHSTFNWALRHAPVAYVSISLLGEPIGSTILAYLILKETPGVIKLVGAALLLIGIVLASRVETSQSVPDVEPAT